MYSPTVGSWKGGVSYERGTPVRLLENAARRDCVARLVKCLQRSVFENMHAHLRTVDEGS